MQVKSGEILTSKGRFSCKRKPNSKNSFCKENPALSNNFHYLSNGKMYKKREKLFKKATSPTSTVDSLNPFNRFTSEEASRQFI